jgi:hypothetical protein
MPAILEVRSQRFEVRTDLTTDSLAPDLLSRLRLVLPSVPVSEANWIGEFVRTSNIQLLTSSHFPGGHTARVTPVPIPNTEVKPRRADDTARVTVWERRSPPGLKLKRPARFLPRPAFLFVGRGIEGNKLVD